MENWTNILGQIPMAAIAIYFINGYIAENKEMKKQLAELDKKIMILEYKSQGS